MSDTPKQMKVAQPYFGHIGALNKRKQPTEAPPEMPTMGGDLTPKQQAALTVEWLQQRINYAQKNNAPSGELSALAARMTAATNLLAKLSGAFEVTHSTILRSSPWQDLVGVLRRVWEKHPAALEDLVKEIDAMEQGTSGGDK